MYNQNKCEGKIKRIKKPFSGIESDIPRAVIKSNTYYLELEHNTSQRHRLTYYLTSVHATSGHLLFKFNETVKVKFDTVFLPVCFVFLLVCTHNTR